MNPAVLTEPIKATHIILGAVEEYLAAVRMDCPPIHLTAVKPELNNWLAQLHFAGRAACTTLAAVDATLAMQADAVLQEAEAAAGVVLGSPCLLPAQLESLRQAAARLLRLNDLVTAALPDHVKEAVLALVRAAR